jgi:aminoglycoside phosphotransferase (APT) family kinase protein
VAAASYGSLGQLSPGQLQAAMDRFGLGRVVRAWPLVEGLFGRNVAVDTTEGAWVLRGATWPPSSDVQLRKEAFFARAIHERCSIPAPWPYLVEGCAGVLPWPYAVMPRLDGRGVDLADPPLERMALAEGLGTGLAELHRVTRPGPGEWRPGADEVVTFEGGAAEWLEARVAAWLLEIARPLDPADEDLVVGSLESACAELGRRGSETTYVHHDFKPTNVSLSRSSCGEIEVVGIFDLNEGYAGDPLEDLPRCLVLLARWHGPAIAERYLAAYQAASGRHIRSELVLAYTVFDLLVLWEFGCRPDRAWFPAGSTFVSWSHSFMGSVRDALGLQ